MRSASKQVPATVADKSKAVVDASAYAEYENESGFQNQSSSDYSIPFLAVLQSNSPQVKDVEHGGLKDAKPGALFNTVTQHLFKGSEGIGFVPAYTEHCYVEWIPKDKGGGLVGRYELNSEYVKQAKANNQEFGKIILSNGNELIETFYVYGMAVYPDGSTLPMTIAFTSTKIKNYKSWMTTARSIQLKVGDRKITPPLFAHRYRIVSYLDKNKKGQEFFNFRVRYDADDAEGCRLAPSDQTFQDAAGLMKLVISGAARADYSGQRAAGDGDDDDSSDGAAAGGQKAAAGGKAPF